MTPTSQRLRKEASGSSETEGGQLGSTGASAGGRAHCLGIPGSGPERELPRLSKSFRAGEADVPASVLHLPLMHLPRGLGAARHTGPAESLWALL